jgi:hypothetical protein
VRSFREADSDTDHYLVVAEVRERLAVSKQIKHRVQMERFNLEKLNEVVGKEQYRVRSFGKLSGCATSGFSRRAQLYGVSKYFSIKLFVNISYFE